MNPKRFLFVCTGNSCRSVMAEKLFKKLVADRGLAWEALSCGTAATRAMGVPSGVKKALAANDVQVMAHMSRSISANLLAWADLALVMSTEHLEAAVKNFPEHSGKVKLFLSHVGMPDPDIADPIGKADQEYAVCCARIRQGLEALIKKYA